MKILLIIISSIFFYGCNNNPAASSENDSKKERFVISDYSPFHINDFWYFTHEGDCAVSDKDGSYNNETIVKKCNFFGRECFASVHESDGNNIPDTTFILSSNPLYVCGHSYGMERYVYQPFFTYAADTMSPQDSFFSSFAWVSHDDSANIEDTDTIDFTVKFLSPDTLQFPAAALHCLLFSIRYNNTVNYRWLAKGIGCVREEKWNGDSLKCIRKLGSAKVKNVIYSYFQD